jgi:hypothetical protein
MPRKKRQIRVDYLKAGFAERPGKSDHRVYTHPLLSNTMLWPAPTGKTPSTMTSATSSAPGMPWKRPSSGRVERGNTHERDPERDTALLYPH